MTTIPSRRAVPCMIPAAVALAFALAGCNGDSGSAGPAAHAAADAKQNLYAALNDLPDWRGAWGDAAWDRGRGGIDSTGGYAAEYPLKPEAKARFLAIRKIAASGGETNIRRQNCNPEMFTGTMGGPESYMEFLFTPGRVTITDEGSRVRRIYTDGRPMPENPGESFQGYSIGHWEGDTLVVQTTGLDRNDNIAPNVPGGMGIFITEHMHLKDENTLQIDSVVEAPAVFTGPYHVTKLYVRHRDYTMVPFECAQNNRDVDENGHQQFDLTPPPGLPPPPDGPAKD